jgi:hypothetical protein
LTYLWKAGCIGAGLEGRGQLASGGRRVSLEEGRGRTSKGAVVDQSSGLIDDPDCEDGHCFLLSTRLKGWRG